MKVLIVFFGKDYHGGSIHSMFAIAKELVRRGHEVHAYVRATRAGILVRDLKDAGIAVHKGHAPIVVHPMSEPRFVYRLARIPLGLVRRFYMAPKSEHEVARIIEDCGIELVALSSGAITTGAASARRANIPYVWHIREFMHEDHGLDWYSWVPIRDLMSGASRLICVSRAIERKVATMCPAARTEVVYNGIDLNRFFVLDSAQADSDLCQDDAPVRIMFSSGIRQSKGTFLLIDALVQMGSTTPFILDVYGDEGDGMGESKKDFLSYCEARGLTDAVRYHGRVSNIADEYRAHDILVVASKAEAFGRVTAEAMLCGCVVVGSDSGGTPELIADDRGYLFEPNDAESLAGKLRQAIDNPEERKLCAERALAFAREHFSENVYIDGIETAYLSSLA